MATVLIVDDEPDIVLFGRVNMEMEGHLVLSAADGEGALEAVRKHHPDVVVLDVMMPKLDGWHVLEQLKADDASTLPPAPGPKDGERALTDKQRALPKALQQAPSVSEAATVLDMSRSNIYAGLRRIGRQLGVTDVTTLLRTLRAGEFDAHVQG